MGEPQRSKLEALGELARILDEVAGGADLPPRERLSGLMRDIHAADLAELISLAPSSARLLLFTAIADDAAEVLASVDEAVRDELLPRLSLERKAQLLQEMANDDAADVLGDIRRQGERARGGQRAHEVAACHQNGRPRLGTPAKGELTS